MATNPHTFTLSPDMAPAAPLMRLLGSFDRLKVEAFAEISIALLDLIDGDCDIEDADADREPNGDELDGSMGEDDFCAHDVPWCLQGPGCPLGDPDQAVDDKGCDDINDDREPEDYTEALAFSDPLAHAEQTKRIQQTRCYRVRSPFVGGGIEHRLLVEPEMPTKRQLLKRKRGVPKCPRA